MVHYFDLNPYVAPKLPGFGTLADERALSGFQRKRTFDSFAIPYTLPPFSHIEKEDFTQTQWSPTLPKIVGRKSLIDPTDSDSEEFASFNGDSSDQSTPEPSSPRGGDSLANSREPVEDKNVALAAQLLLTLWSRTSRHGTTASQSSKKTKVHDKLAGEDEEPYVPRSLAPARRSKKHVNKDVRIPNSCETHKRRHLKCPLDCDERLRREAEMAANNEHDDDNSLEGEAYGSGSDAERYD